MVSVLAGGLCKWVQRIDGDVEVDEICWLEGSSAKR